jgi:hypothetical protein
MKYIKLILGALMLIFSFSAVFADVITETPEVFSFKLESATNKEAKFSFGVDNRKSNIIKYNYVLRLENNDEMVDEVVYDDSLLVSPGKIKGEVFTYEPKKEFSANKSILYLTDPGGTVLSLNILDNLKLNFKGVGSVNKPAPECSYDYETNEVACFFTGKTDKINSINIKLYKNSVYGPSLKEEVISSEKIKRNGKKISFSVRNLNPGFYILKIGIDGYEEAVVEFRKSGAYSDINLVLIKNNVTKKGQDVNLEISLNKGEATKMQVALLDKGGEICAFKEFSLDNNEKYNLTLDKDCQPSSVTAYLLDSQGKVLAQYGDEVESSELTKKIAENNKKINLMNSGVDIFSKNLIA